MADWSVIQCDLVVCIISLEDICFIDHFVDVTNRRAPDLSIVMIWHSEMREHLMFWLFSGTQFDHLHQKRGMRDYIIICTSIRVFVFIALDFEFELMRDKYGWTILTKVIQDECILVGWMPFFFSYTSNLYRCLQSCLMRRLKFTQSFDDDCRWTEF